jgi:hypothetical protein
MLENTYYITIIVGAIVGTAISTVTILFSLQKSFRIHLDNLFKSYDKSLKSWIKTSLEEYYLPLDQRLNNHSFRIKALEKK